ncbi:hypothetical protein [Cesiribacter andamanensis]|uniref:Methionyl-tRNA formyltransferase n=1 Tax=Cesiribacter andamanensis AMV16 TaxID=1279009 RepID=M7P2L2_9BACT|nr:hypothetical protein [Cesiribacter andamanensis]EMR04769.1 hypothetical protein ADICEAN_00040 [Cesiribacter andamanensis AMV16]
MRILLFTQALNGLSQRAYSELVERGHTVHIQTADSNTAMELAAAHYQPQLIIASFLHAPLPDSLLKKYTVLAVRPGSGTDRGPARLDGTPAQRWQNWRITVLQAPTEADAGGIWSSKKFGMNPSRQTPYYQHHFTHLAVQSILESVEKLENKSFSPLPLLAAHPLLAGRLHRMKL